MNETAAQKRGLHSDASFFSVHLFVLPTHANFAVAAPWTRTRWFCVLKRFSHFASCVHTEPGLFLHRLFYLRILVGERGQSGNCCSHSHAACMELVRFLDAARKSFFLDVIFIFRLGRSLPLPYTFASLISRLFLQTIKNNHSERMRELQLQVLIVIPSYRKMFADKWVDAENLWSFKLKSERYYL